MRIAIHNINEQNDDDDDDSEEEAEEKGGKIEQHEIDSFRCSFFAIKFDIYCNARNNSQTIPSTNISSAADTHTDNRD